MVGHFSLIWYKNRKRGSRAEVEHADHQAPKALPSSCPTPKHLLSSKPPHDPKQWLNSTKGYNYRMVTAGQEEGGQKGKWPLTAESSWGTPASSPTEKPYLQPTEHIPSRGLTQLQKQGNEWSLLFGWQCARLKRRSLLPGKTSRVGREGEPAAKCTGNSSRQTSTSDADGRS